MITSHQDCKITTRTQAKLQLQRTAFLAQDPNDLNHPTNMKRLTRALNLVDSDYKSVRKYEDPIKNSLSRLKQNEEETYSGSSPISLPNNTHSQPILTSSLSKSVPVDYSNSSSASSSTNSSPGSYSSSFLTKLFTSSGKQNGALSSHPTIVKKISKRRESKHRK